MVFRTFQAPIATQGLRTLDFDITSGEGRQRQIVAPVTLGSGRATLYKVRRDNLHRP